MRGASEPLVPKHLSLPHCSVVEIGRTREMKRPSLFTSLQAAIASRCAMHLPYCEYCSTAPPAHRTGHLYERPSSHAHQGRILPPALCAAASTSLLCV